uniref:hypothetical protein n=1 Tax=Gemmiger formicilis TaxID=745368 RepID=UPI004027D43D
GRKKLAVRKRLRAKQTAKCEFSSALLREKCCAVKKSVRGFSGGAGGSAVTKKRGQRGKRLIERNFLTTEEKTEKFSFLYCEFYSEQKIRQESSIVRKSIRKKQKVLREIFSAEKIA